MSQPHRRVSTQLRRSPEAPATRSWRSVEVAALVVAACYGAATLMMATAIFLRLIR